jgi:hypothetical protein
MKNLFQALFGKLGYRITRLGSVCKSGLVLDSFSTLLKSFDVPRNISDVGANPGPWSRTALGYFPGAPYTLIRPLHRLRMHIEDLLSAGHHITWINADAGDRSGTSPFAGAIYSQGYISKC